VSSPDRERSFFSTDEQAVLMDVKQLRIELDREEDGRWIAEVADVPGAVTYGDTRDEAISRAEALAFRVVADRLENGEPVPAGRTAV
jgi:predicted RNase H-like HicB family nuclease